MCVCVCVRVCQRQLHSKQGRDYIHADVRVCVCVDGQALCLSAHKPPQDIVSKASLGLISTSKCLRRGEQLKDANVKERRERGATRCECSKLFKSSNPVKCHARHNLLCCSAVIKHDLVMATVMVMLTLMPTLMPTLKLMLMCSSPCARLTPKDPLPTHQLRDQLSSGARAVDADEGGARAADGAGAGARAGAWARCYGYTSQH